MCQHLLSYLDYSDKNFSHLNPGDLLTVKVDEASDYDLWGAEVR